MTHSRCWWYPLRLHFVSLRLLWWNDIPGCTLLWFYRLLWRGQGKTLDQPQAASELSHLPMFTRLSNTSKSPLDLLSLNIHPCASNWDLQKKKTLRCDVTWWSHEKPLHLRVLSSVISVLAFTVAALLLTFRQIHPYKETKRHLVCSLQTVSLATNGCSRHCSTCCIIHETLFHTMIEITQIMCCVRDYEFRISGEDGSASYIALSIILPASMSLTSLSPTFFSALSHYIHGPCCVWETTLVHLVAPFCPWISSTNQLLLHCSK